LLRLSFTQLERVLAIMPKAHKTLAASGLRAVLSVQQTGKTQIIFSAASVSFEENWLEPASLRLPLRSVAEVEAYLAAPSRPHRSRL
jgi:hypothetical protein